MKTFLWIATIVGVVVLALFGLRKLRVWMGRNNDTSKQDAAATLNSQTRDRQAGAAYSKVLPPAASWVRMNGALIDLNPIGGTIPTLVTLPIWPTNLGPG